MAKKSVNAERKNFIMHCLRWCRKGRGKGREYRKEETVLHISRVLIGKLLSNNLINLGIYEEVKRNFPMPVKVLQI